MQKPWKFLNRRADSALIWALLGVTSHAQSVPVVSGQAPAPAPATTTAPSEGLRNISLLPEAAPTLATAIEQTSQPMRLLVGRSAFIKTLSRLKRVYVSNPAVVDCFISSPQQLVITAKDAGVTSLILWDEAGQSTTYLLFSDIDVSSLQTEIHRALPYDNITVESKQDRVALFGSVIAGASADAAVKLAGLYTKNVVNSLVVNEQHIPQVRLKCQIVEIDRSKIEEFGFNILSQGKNTSASQTGQFGSVSTGPSATASAPTLTLSSPLNLLFYNSGLNLGVTLQDLQNRQLAQILAEPTITTISGQKGSFLAGGEFPFPVVQGSSGGLTSVTIQFRPYGVRLEFTPIVNGDGTIQLKVTPEVSALDYSNAVTISGYTVPALSTRRADTQVELRDGQSFVISGLLDHRTTDIFDKMPGIGDVPILGQLFRSKNVNHSTAELIVVVTPTIVDPLHDTSVPTVPTLPVPMLDPKQFDKFTQPKSGHGKPQTGSAQ